MRAEERLRAFPWSQHGVVYAILFGSSTRRAEARDVDVAVRLEDGGLEAYSALLEALTGFLAVDEDRLDLVSLSEELPCHLVVEIYTKGVLVYCRSLEAYLEDLRRLLNPCLDYLIDQRKLRTTELLLEAVRRLGGRS